MSQRPSRFFARDIEAPASFLTQETLLVVVSMAIRPSARFDIPGHRSGVEDSEKQLPKDGLRPPAPLHAAAASGSAQVLT